VAVTALDRFFDASAALHQRTGGTTMTTPSRPGADGISTEHLAPVLTDFYTGQ